MSTETFEQLSEWPLATRDECWRAFRPAQPFSDSAFQRLRREELVSAGIRLHRRRRGQVHGQERCFSRLNLLALNAYRLGDEVDARHLARRAGELEARHEVRDLVKMLEADEPCDPSSEPSSPQWSLLLAKVCKLTDSISGEARHSPTRFPAIVRALKGGMAVLVLKHGDTIAFSEVKLSSIVRDSPGAAVYLYLIDLGGTDELIRARPGVQVEGDQATRSRRGMSRGVFEKIVTTAEGHEADLLDELLSGPAPVRDIDLTGLRVVQ